MSTKSTKERLKDAYDRLQGMEIRATRGNLEALLLSLYDLQNAYNELTEGEANGTGTGENRPEDHPEGQNGL